MKLHHLYKYNVIMPCYVKKRSTHINNLYKYISSNTDTKYMLYSYLLTYIKQWIYKYNSYNLTNEN